MLYYLFLITTIAFGITNVPMIRACNAYFDPCPDNRCCLLLVKLRENIVWSKCVRQRKWPTGRCTQSDNYCARHTDCHENQFCRGASNRAWGECRSECLWFKRVN